MKIKNLLSIIVLIGFLSLNFLPIFTVNAQSSADFEINTTYTINYEPPNDYVEIEEEIHLLVNNDRYYFPAKDERVFNLPDFSLQEVEGEREFKINSVRIEDENGIEIKPEISETETGVQLTIADKRDITYGNDEKIKISYKTHELVDSNGNIINLYIPGLPESTEFVKVDDQYDLETRYSFETELTVPSTAPEASYTFPQGDIDIRTFRDERTYSISQEDRVGETAWIQLGTSQYYYFKMVQPTPKTDNLIPTEISKFSDLISTNIYQLPLPKENPETNQKVYFNKIEPSPVRIEVDQEGNYIATFEVPANEDGEIIVEGYISLQSESTLESVKDIQLQQYSTLIGSDANLQRYTLPDQYWESNDPVITSVADQLYSESSTILELIRNNYNFVIETLDYSYDKVEGVNERLGALAALQGADAVCMEYSDSLIAIMRSQGLPARAAIGYGNDPTGAENLIGSDEAEQQNIGHQWMQVWVPEYGWLSVDATWGESGREYIGPNLDHILWYTVADSEQGYVGTSLSTADPVSQAVLSSYDVYLRALPEDEFNDVQGLLALSEISSQFQGVEPDELSTFIKTTSVGKVAIIATPIMILLFILFVVLSSLSAVLKGYLVSRKKKAKPKDVEFKDEYKM